MDASADAPPDRLPLRRDRGFHLFVAARTLGVAGYAVSAVAMPVLLLELTGSPFAVSLVAALEVVPYLAFGLLAGAVADRVDRRRLAVSAQVASALLLASVPVADVLAEVTAVHVLAVALGAATCFVWFDAATFGLLPALVGRERLPQANSAVFTAATLADVIVPALAGFLVATVGAALALGVDAACYVIAAALLAGIAGRAHPADAAADAHPVGGAAAGRVRPSVRADIREGLAWLWGHRVVRSFTLVGTASSVTAGGVTALLVVIATGPLGLATSDARIGWVWTAAALGALAGALALPRLTARVPVGWITITSLSATPVAVLCLAAAPSLWPGLAAVAGVQAAVTVTILNGITTRQRLTPDAMQSRVNTTARMLAWGGSPVGALLGGALAEAASVRVALACLAVPAAVGAVAAARSPLRRRSLSP